MGDIESESKFIWKLILNILLTPITLLLIIFKKKEFNELFKPFYDIIKFVFEPKFTIIIIILNVAISLWAAFLLSEVTFNLLMNYPQDLLHLGRLYSLITNGFIHSSPTHLIGNMIGIFIFGRVVERKIGMSKTALVYFGALIISSVGDSAINLLMTNSNMPALGASGALMGLVATAILIDPLYITYELIIPLPIMISGWLAIYGDFSGILNPNGDAVSYFAHIFGYLSITLIMFLLSNENRSELKKGLIINLVSLGIAGIIYFLIISGYIPSFNVPLPIPS